MHINCYVVVVPTQTLFCKEWLTHSAPEVKGLLALLILFTARTSP